jgi:hypothetical protein
MEDASQTTGAPSTPPTATSSSSVPKQEPINKGPFTSSTPLSATPAASARKQEQKGPFSASTPPSAAPSNSVPKQEPVLKPQFSSLGAAAAKAPIPNASPAPQPLAGFSFSNAVTGTSIFGAGFGIPASGNSTSGSKDTKA